MQGRDRQALFGVASFDREGLFEIGQRFGLDTCRRRHFAPAFAGHNARHAFDDRERRPSSPNVPARDFRRID